MCTHVSVKWHWYFNMRIMIIDKCFNIKCKNMSIKSVSAAKGLWDDDDDDGSDGAGGAANATASHATSSVISPLAIGVNSQHESEFKTLYLEELERRKDLEELVKDMSAEIASLKAQMKSLKLNAGGSGGSGDGGGGGSGGVVDTDDAHWEALKQAEKERKSKSRTVQRPAARRVAASSSNSSSNSGSTNNNSNSLGSNNNNNNNNNVGGKSNGNHDINDKHDNILDNTISNNVSKSKGSGGLFDESEEEEEEENSSVSMAYNSSNNSTKALETADVSSKKPFGSKPSKKLDLYATSDNDDNADGNGKIRKNGANELPNKSKIDLFASDDDSDFEKFLSKSVEKIRRSSIGAKNVPAPPEKQEGNEVAVGPPEETSANVTETEWDRLAREVREQKNRQRRQLAGARGRPTRRPGSSTSTSQPAGAAALPLSKPADMSLPLRNNGNGSSDILAEKHVMAPANASNDAWSSDSDDNANIKKGGGSNDAVNKSNNAYVNVNKSSKNNNDEWSDSDDNEASASAGNNKVPVVVNNALSEEEAIDMVILEWCTSTANSIVAMIITLPSIFSEPLPELGSPWSMQEYITCVSGHTNNSAARDQAVRLAYTPAVVRKAYLNSVRFCHPDKISASSSTYVKLLAMKVFTALTDAYNLYKGSL